jgi:signal transduction histidine kinase
VLPHIFEPFFTTKQAGDGSGLGLDIAQQIIRQHDGRLEVHSVPGRTELCAWLPVMGG